MLIDSSIQRVYIREGTGEAKNQGPEADAFRRDYPF